MPLMSILVKTTLSVIALALSVTGYGYMKSPNDSREMLYQKIHYTKKLKPPLTVKLNMVEDKILEPGETYTIEAVIESPKSYRDLEWEWFAPAEVALLDRTVGSGLSIKANEPTKITMRFKQGAFENKRIKLVLKDRETDQIVGRGRIQTLRHRAIASENAELMKRQEEYLRENPDTLRQGHRPKHTH